MTARKGSFDFPQLESKLKKSRILSNIAALDILGKEDEIHKLVSSAFKESCILSADNWRVVDDLSEYARLGVEYGNGVTLVSAQYSKNPVGEHFQLHSGTFHLLNGAIKFKINGVEVIITPGSVLKIPAKSHYECEMLTDAAVIIGIPTEVIENL